MSENKKKNFIVYKHRNLLNNKVYIGITCKTPNQRWQNGEGYRENHHFYNAIQKYGWNEGFEHIVLANNLSQSEAEKKEISLIAKYDSSNPEKGYNRNLGGHYAGQHSIATKKKISEIQKKIVYQYDRYTGEFLNSYNSTLDAEAQLNIPNPNISAVCLKKMKTSHGFIFRYAENGYEYGKSLSNEELKLINSNASATLVGKFDVNNNLIISYPQIKIAVENDIDAPKNKSYMYKILDSNILVNGYYWKRIKNIYSEKFSTLYSQSKNIPKKVIQYSPINLDIIKIYDSIEIAEKETSIKAKYIRQSCNNKHLKAGGFIWQYYSNGNNVLKIDDYADKRNIGKSINQFSIEGKFIKQYNSIANAAKELNGSTSNISRCLRGLNKTAFGYIWKYA